MNILLIVIVVLLFLIADHIGVFSKNEWLIPLICFCVVAYFYPLIAESIAAGVGAIWVGFWLPNLPSSLRKKRFNKKIAELFEKHGSPLPLEHREELRKLYYERDKGTLDGYRPEMEEVEELVKTKFGGDWSAYWRAWDNRD
jgi:hypothetical protein